MKSLIRFFLRLACCSSGSAVVEASVIVPVAVSLMVGGVDFGRALVTQATGTKSVRDAARYLSLLPSSALSDTWATTNATNLALYGNTAGTGSLLISDCWSSQSCWNSNNVHINVNTTGPATCPIQITVSATFPYNSWIVIGLLPKYFPQIASNPITMSATHEECSIGE
jgi:Flp pilus assembly protein TadG